MLFEKIKSVKAFVLDVDGVLTKGDVLVTEDGQQLRSFNTRDGYALQLAVKKDYPIAVITGGKSAGVQRRMEGLGIKDVYLGVHHKVNIFNEWLEQKQLKARDVLYIGDDIPDLEIMQVVGLAGCPADAAEEIKAVAHYISPKNGGEGAVRDIIEKVMKLQAVWDNNPTIKSV